MAEKTVTVTKAMALGYLRDGAVLRAVCGPNNGTLARTEKVVIFGDMRRCIERYAPLSVEVEVPDE